MIDPSEAEVENKINDLEKQIKDLEGGLAMKNDLEENEKLYRYLLEQKNYELIEQRAKEKLADVEKIKNCEHEIQKAEKKLIEIEKIKELREKLSTVNKNN